MKRKHLLGTSLSALILFVGLVHADTPVKPDNQQLVSVDQLKSEAFKALRGGDFDRTNDLIAKAASMSSDPNLTQMSAWVHDFETQRQTFQSERRKQYDKAVADVQKLMENHKDTYAIDSAARAYSLADDKDAFRKEPWVEELLKHTVQMAADGETHEEWLRTARLYSDLSQIEPANPEWKDRLKLVMRRIRLLATYTPDALKAVQEAESKDRAEADALLNPTTQPATKPVAAADPGDSDAFKIDWRETVKGIQMSMLRTSLAEAESNYWRAIDYKTLMVGGLKGVQAIVTTRGLEKNFPGLADSAKRTEFLKDIDGMLDRCNKAGADDDSKLLGETLEQLNGDNHSTVQIEDEVLISEFADGAFAELDPFTSMIWPYDVEEFNKSTQGEFSGVGIQIQLDDDGSLKVVSPLEDTPAYRSGVKAGDIITRINGKSAHGITINQAVKTITGVEGTNVTLTIRSQTKDGPLERDYVIRREKIKVASVKGWQHLPGGGWEYFVDPDQKIGYLRITNFTKSTGEELSKAVEEMKNHDAKAIIMDLRYNPGGLLTAATDVADKFLSEGTIVSTKTDPSRDSPVQAPLEAHRSDDDCNLPLVVLVNQYSASASEIVSGALKDWNRALIVGERTFGKGSVQMLFPLKDRSAYLKLTTSHYYLPGGRCIHREENSTTWGVDPDVTVEMTPEQMRAAIDARQELDILRDAGAVAPATTQPNKDLMSVDPQLSAAVLLLRMQLNGATL
jgi:carboxyl-terminal processing protease